MAAIQGICEYEDSVVLREDGEEMTPELLLIETDGDVRWSRQRHALRNAGRDKINPRGTQTSVINCFKETLSN